MKIKTDGLLECITLVVMFNKYEMHQDEINILKYLKKRDKDFETLAEIVHIYRGKMEVKSERILFYKRNELKSICYSMEYVRETKEFILYFPYESSHYTRYNNNKRRIFKKYELYEISLVFEQIKEFEREGNYE